IWAFWGCPLGLGSVMATVVNVRARGVREHRFFFVSACVMAATIVAGFSLQWLMGRSTLRAPLHVHSHAWLLMGWTAFYVFPTHLSSEARRDGKEWVRTFG